MSVQDQIARITARVGESFGAVEAFGVDVLNATLLDLPTKIAEIASVYASPWYTLASTGTLDSKENAYADRIHWFEIGKLTEVATGSQQCSFLIELAASGDNNYPTFVHSYLEGSFYANKSENSTECPWSASLTLSSNPQSIEVYGNNVTVYATVSDNRRLWIGFMGKWGAYFKFRKLYVGSKVNLYDPATATILDSYTAPLTKYITNNGSFRINGTASASTETASNPELFSLKMPNVLVDNVLTSEEKAFFDRWFKYTSIGADKDINSPEFLICGQYYCQSNATALNIANLPEKLAFNMLVYSIYPTMTNYNNASYAYITRVLNTVNGSTYIQYVYPLSNPSIGTFRYGQWQKVVTSSDLSAYLPLSGGAMTGDIVGKSGNEVIAFLAKHTTNRSCIYTYEGYETVSVNSSVVGSYYKWKCVIDGDDPQNYEGSVYYTQSRDINTSTDLYYIEYSDEDSFKKSAQNPEEIYTEAECKLSNFSVPQSVLNDGDELVIRKSSTSAIGASNISFNTTLHNKFLCQDGTWKAVGSSGSSGTVSGDYLPLSGGSMTGAIACVNNNATLGTFSAPAYRTFTKQLLLGNSSDSTSEIRFAGSSATAPGFRMIAMSGYSTSSGGPYNGLLFTPFTDGTSTANSKYGHFVFQDLSDYSIPDDSTLIARAQNNTYALRVNGDSICTGKMSAANGFFQTSDIRLKNIHEEIDLNKAYDLIDKCLTILYDLKDDEKHKELLGLIAQEVEEFFPEIISEDKDGFKSLDYAKLTVVILRVLKDLIKRISKLEENK